MNVQEQKDIRNKLKEIRAISDGIEFIILNKKLK